MAYSQSSQSATERRCTNCGTRVARDAEVCFMCGQDLRIKPQRKQRVSWIDALLVLAVIGILGFWWQAGAQTEQATIEEPAEQILPEIIPVLDSTSTPTATPEPTATATVAPPKEVTLSHQVSAGETLLAIAGTYGVTVDQIMQANNRVDEFIRVGETLRIPIIPSDDTTSTAASTFPYQVQEGDTVASIASITSSSVSDILIANNLGANGLIRPGQVLTIPSQLPREVFENPAPDAAQPTTASNNEEGSENIELSSIYIQPSLLAPPNDAIFSRDESILLRWASVSILEPNEWYVVQINPSDGSAPQILPQWKKTNTHRLSNEFAPSEALLASETEGIEYSWQVSVIRVSNGPEGTRLFTPTSPPSDIRIFTWR